ncbi:MAG: OpgC domain-containing protein [Chloroflexota bacterium]|nr:OpgC domain-containing protein [Chloroflexota bacterium]
MVTVTRERSGVRAALDRWRYDDPARRDLRLDLLRGYAVFAMICDHVAGISWITPFTGANRFVASAAEAFVFVAGLLVGMVYGRRALRDGWLVAAEAVLHRATILYGATVGLTLLFVALFEFTDLRLWLDRAYGLGLTDPVELVVGTLTLHYTYHGTDILWLYVILFAFSPIVLLLLAVGRWWLVLAASWLLWLTYQFFPSQATIPWVATNVNYFPVAAWQVLFMNGILIGYYRGRVAGVLRRIPPGAWLIMFAVGLLSLVLIQRGYDTGRLAGWPLVGRLAGELYVVLFDKPSLAPGRLVAFAIVAGFAYSLVTQFWAPIRRALGWLLVLLGTNALRAYGVHLLVIVLVYNVEPFDQLYDRSRTANTILQVVTVGLTLAVILAWRRLERGVAWRPSLPDLALSRPQRRVVVGTALALVVASAGLYAGLVGGVQAERQATPAEAMEEAGVLRFVPPDVAPGEVVPIVLALSGYGQTGPEFAGPLVGAAREAGWSIIAPTIAYGDWADSGQVAGDAVQTMPLLLDLLRDQIEETDQASPSPVYVVGEGRGAHTAINLALLYPDVVTAVATVGPAPCTVPASAATEAAGVPALPFPFGVDDLEQYVGEEFTPEAVTTTAYWLGISPALDEAAGGCPWDAMAGRDPVARAELFRSLVTRLGGSAQVVVLDGSAARDDLLAGALDAFRSEDARQRR